MPILPSHVERKENSDIYFYSILLAALVNVSSINSICVAIIPAVAGRAMALMYLLIYGIIICSAIYRKKGLNTKIYNVVIIIYIFVVFAYSAGFKQISNLTPVQLAVYSLLPLLLLCNMRIDSETFISASILLNLPGVFLTGKIFSINRNAISMGVSYSFLLPTLCALAYLIRLKNKKFVLTVASVLELIYLYMIVFHGSRGVVLSLFFGLAVLLFVSKKPSENGIKTSSLGLLAVFGIALILILNIENIIIGVYNLAVNAGYDLKFLSKTIRMMRESNTLNGRESIFSTTISGIAQAPVLGHGISTFYYYTGIEYPHNFILQMLYDIGFVGFSLVFIPFLFGIWRFCKACDSDSYLIGVLLFSASVPGALFSHDLWVNITLWATLSFFIGFATKNRDSFIRLRV